VIEHTLHWGFKSFDVSDRTVQDSVYLQMVQSFLPKAQNGIILCVGVSIGSWKDSTPPPDEVLLCKHSTNCMAVGFLRRKIYSC
jgi:hypothetical protein